MTRFRLAAVVGAALLLAAWTAVPAWPAQAQEPVAKYATILDVVYAQPEGEALRADVLVPQGQGPFPGVLVIHGGAWSYGSRTQLRYVGRQLAERGYTAVLISYRLAPKHLFPAQSEDCQAALRWMRQNAEKYKIDPGWIAAWGYSAGGHLAALLGATGAAETHAEAGGNGNGNGQPAGDPPSLRVQAVVAGGAPCDFRELPPEDRSLAFWLGGTRKEKPEAYRLASPRQFVSQQCPPMFFFHGAEDRLVPLLSPRQMADDLKALGVKARLHVIEKKGHVGAMFDSDTITAAIDFLDEVRAKK
jgi:acetyl esterase/lipase